MGRAGSDLVAPGDTRSPLCALGVIAVEPDAPQDVDDTGDTGPDDEVMLPEERVYDPIPGAWDESFVTLLPGLIADLGARAYDAVRDPVSGNVYVGGIFTQIGPDYHLNVAAWHRETGFASLGDGLEITVNALALDGDGALYATGRGASGGFGFGSPNTISQWDGITWTTLGTTSSFEPAWVLYVDGDDLWVGGECYNITTEDGESSVESPFLARWDGTQWHAGPGGPNGGPNGVVRAITRHGDDLCIGGNFDLIGDLAVQNVACHGASGWYGVGDGLDSEVHTLLATNGALYAGGYFSFGDPSGPAEEFYVGIGRLDGETWEPVGGGVINGTITNVWTIDEAPDGGLFVGGDFRQVNAASPRAANNIARLDGGQWTTFGGVRDDSGNTLLSEGGPRSFVFDGDEVIVAGLFSSVGDDNVQAPGIARLDEGPPAAWSALLEVDGPSLGIAGGINSVSFDPDGNIIAAGGFGSAGGSTTPNIAKLTDEGWMSLGDGLDDAVWVTHAASDGVVWAGGRFTSNFGRFTNGAWSFPGPVDGQVQAIVEDADGTISIGGDLTMAGGTSSGAPRPGNTIGARPGR